MVQLKLAFVKSGTDEPVVLPKTFMTIYDVDQTNHPTKECQSVQGVSNFILSEKTELQVFRTAAERLDPFVKPIDDLVAKANLPAWREPYVCSTVKGMGADNPTDPVNLTPVQRNRAIMILLEDRSEFYARLGVPGVGLKTGRNFLFRCAHAAELL